LIFKGEKAVKRKFLFAFGCGGFVVAIVLFVIRFYLLRHDPLYGGWFDILTVALWPGAFYLLILQSSEPSKVIFFVYSVAVTLNVVIYTLIGWLIFSITTRIQRPSPPPRI
jgi:hypothetical protein